MWSFPKYCTKCADYLDRFREPLAIGWSCSIEIQRELSGPCFPKNTRQEFTEVFEGQYNQEWIKDARDE